MYNHGESIETVNETSALFVRGGGHEGDNKKKPWCDYCKKLWHTRDNCWKIHGKPPGGKKKPEKAFQAMAETSKEQQINSGHPTFAQDQIEQLLKLLQATQKTLSPDTPSFSFAQDGKTISISS